MKKQKELIITLLIILLISSCKESIFEPEDQFVQIYFKYGFRNELNTFENTYQKDLVWNGVIKIRFYLTTEEQNKILDKINSIDYFSLPDTFKYIPEDSISLIALPNPGEQLLRIKYRHNDKETIWTYPINEDNPQVENLMELNYFIISIIESKPEYKRLPPAKGGYD